MPGRVLLQPRAPGENQLLVVFSISALWCLKQADVCVQRSHWSEHKLECAELVNDWGDTKASLRPGECHQFVSLAANMLHHVSSVIQGPVRLECPNDLCQMADGQIAALWGQLWSCQDPVAMVNDFVEVSISRGWDTKVLPLAACLEWANHRRGPRQFGIVEYTPKGATFVDSDGVAYRVLGLKDSVQAALKGVQLPIVVVAVLLPWMGRIVHQGQMLIPKQLEPEEGLMEYCDAIVAGDKVCAKVLKSLT